MRKLLISSIAIITAFVLWECSRPENEFSDFHTFDHYGWIYGDTVALSMPDNLPDSVVTGYITVTLSHTNNYPYSNIWIEVSRRLDDSTAIADTVNIQLADIYGNWLGHGTGLSITKTDTVFRDITMAKGQPLNLRHVMRIDTLPEIERIGITFHPVHK